MRPHAHNQRRLIDSELRSMQSVDGALRLISDPKANETARHFFAIRRELLRAGAWPHLDDVAFAGRANSTDTTMAVFMPECIPQRI